MAPVTRRSQQSNGSGIAKKAPTRKTRSASIKEPTDTWSLDVPRSRGIEQPAENVDEALEDAALVATTSADVSDALNPLREMAEKVGREVETFAEDLDKFLESLPSRNNYGVVLDLVDNFKAVAVDSAASLAQSYEKDRAQQLRNEWSVGAESANASNALAAIDARPASSKKQSKHVRQLRAWQQEADIWDLFRIVLEEHYNPDKAAVQQKKSQALSDLGPVHRYTTEADIWSRFILDNNLARERVKIKKWLEQAADHQESSIEDISAELEVISGRGKGLWSQGWLHTREKIKHEKRLRPWSNSAPTSLPQIKNSDGNGLLASNLDPDAATRQERSLEQPDAYFERAFWMVCWEMLRRGKSWAEISDWCDARREGWRAALIEQPSQSHVAASSSQWRSVCRIASRAACSCDYEAAVYGLLGGNALATQKVCHTIDEQLYAYYSTALTRQFDQYLASNFPDRAANQRRMVIDDDLQNPQEAITALIVKLRTQQKTKHEAGQPMKTVQSYLLANEAESLIHTIGFALSDNDKLTKKKPDEDMIIQFGQLNSAEEAEAAIDPQALRIIAHISIILNVLSNNSLEGEERDAEENVLVAYIQTLRVARKRDLIPVYASRLSVARYVLAISRVMQDITSSREQEQTLKLLENYGLDIIMILKEQLAFLLNRLMALPRPKRALTLLEATKVTPLYPGSRIIENFLPTEFTDDDDAVIRSLQWFYILHGRWNDTFQALSSALRQCLITGRLASALLIVEQFPYETISIRKSYQVIGKSVNLMDHDGPAPDDEQPVWDLLKRQSRTYYELEQLVNAIKALADWRDKESDYTKKAPKLSSAPPALRAAKDAVDEAMLPVLGGLLCNPLDAQEAEDLDSIRLAYIPEIILAYNTVLHSAGSLISRDNLIQSMDLSTTIAQDQNDIAQCFVRAKRMRELVMSFAETSKAMLVLKEAGRPWRPKKEREGKDLGLWEIGPQAHQIGELPNGQQREAQHA